MPPLHFLDYITKDGAAYGTIWRKIALAQVLKINAIRMIIYCAIAGLVLFY
jgi:hypothetical protein